MIGLPVRDVRLLTLKRRKYFRQRYLANRDRLLEQMKVYQAAHPEVVKRAQAKYYAKNREEMKRARRERYASDPEADYATHRKWIEENKDTRAVYMREWRAECFEQRKAYDKAYRETHRAERSAVENARRARKTGNGGSHTKAEWHERLAEYENRCGYCGVAGASLTKDHATPLSRGGTDDIGNIIPACLPCNRRKHAKTADEFRAA